MAPSGFSTVGVIGCGLIGGSFALAAAAVPDVRRVLVSDRDPAVEDEARARGIGEVVDRAHLLGASDLVVLAVPVPAIPGLAAEALAAMPDGSVLTDVGSVKTRVVREVEALGRDHGAVFVGGHPMAGRELDGLAGAEAGLFQGAAYVLTPTEGSPTAPFNRLAAFLRALGARVLAVDPETHDRVVAVVSHLPQVVATTVMAYAAGGADADPGLLAMAGGAFRDVTRVAASNPELWAGILLENRATVLTAIAGFAGSLEDLRGALQRGDRDALIRALEAGRRGRTLLPGKDVDATVVDVVVPIDDRPGALAAVTTALGAAGINIEDVSMRHAEEGARGALIVAVAGEEAAARARDTLATRGFASHLEPR